MKNLKTFESYLSDKMKNVQDKFNKLKKIIDFINKYKLEYFIISTESNDNMFEEISKNEDGDYYLTYNSYEGKKETSHETEISQLPYAVVDDLIATCEKTYRFTVEFALESSGNINMFINILKNYKEPIKFTGWMFSMLIENDLQAKSNTFNFQDLLFSTHPESFNIFMDELIESVELSKGKDWEPLKIAPGIEKKYKNLFDDYEVYKSSKKYNL